MSMKFLKIARKLQSLKNSQTKRAFSFIVNNENIMKNAKFFHIIFKNLMMRPFKLWVNFRTSSKTKGQGLGSMKKGKQKLRSARQTTKPFLVHLRSLLSKKFRKVLESINRRINDLKIQRHSLMSLAKIVRKNISTSLNRWKIFIAQKQNVSNNKRNHEINEKVKNSINNGETFNKIVENS
jgi:hypothetical protein